MRPAESPQKPLLLLIHGAWHSAACWQGLIPLLDSEGLEFLAPDLPGHGQNSQYSGRISLKVYSRYISHIIDNYNNKLIIVGHSMAGMLISQVAAERPEPISRLVYLSAYLPQSGQSLFDLMQTYRQNYGPAPIEDALQYSEDKMHCSLRAEDLCPLFYNTCTPSQQQAARTLIQTQASLPLAGKVSFDQKYLKEIPKTYIRCLQDKVIPEQQYQDMLLPYPDVHRQTLDSDHSPFYSHPEKLARILVNIVNENSSY